MRINTPHRKAGNSEVQDGREQECGGWRYSIEPSLESSCTIRKTRLHMFTRETWGAVESVPCFTDQNRRHHTKNSCEHGIRISSNMGKACFYTYCGHDCYILKQSLINIQSELFQSKDYWPVFPSFNHISDYSYAISHTATCPEKL